ncbi:MAG: putative DNA binding domain-containing protein [Bacteroidales bacterium]|nr:putative DNA binding domain-containing protein [Bacteroidales bacterium]
MRDYKAIFQRLVTNVEHEVIEFKTAENQYDRDKLGKYFSALSNEANLRDVTFAWIVMGVNNDRQIVGTQFLMDDTKRQLLKHEIAANTTGGLTFRDIVPIEVDGKRVLLFQIPAAPRNIVTKWKGVAYGQSGESLEPLSQDKYDAIRHQRPVDDWSAHVIEDATVKNDLDELALAKARIEFKKVYDKLPPELVDGWSQEEFLRHSGLLNNGKLTRGAFLLLGKPTVAYKLSPAIPQITWTLVNDEGRKINYQHFTIPFILTVDEMLGRIRNLTMREMPGGTLFPEKLMQYDDFIIREVLHNAIAHQDYTLCQRINFIEGPDYLYYSNAGTFYPETIENALDTLKQQKFYRNECLCKGMVSYNMIDTVSSGIQTMFYKQKERHFPMPDYEINENVPEVNVKIYGRIIDERYVELLKRDASLSLKECIWLDAIQKKRPVTEEALRILKSKKLIEWHKPNYIISQAVAQKTHQVPEYTKQKGLDKNKLLNMLQQVVEDAGDSGIMLNEIYEYMQETLSSNKTMEAKKRSLRYLLHLLKESGIVYLDGLKWKAKKENI